MALRKSVAERSNWTPEPTYPKPDISVDATRLYYGVIAPLMLPWIEGRLLNLFRCKEGRCFFQRSRAHPPSGDTFQPPIHLQPIEQKNGRTEDYLFVTDVEGILACAEADAVEFHGWGSRVGSVETPDRLVIDLDPGDDVGFEQIRDGAFRVRRSFAVIGLQAFALLTGGKGIHVVVPIRPEPEWPDLRAFAKAFCTTLAEADPHRFTVALPKERRAERIFLDYLRNQRTATAVLPYSARARDGSPVAVPVAWEELDNFDRADAFSIADAERLLRRAKQKRLKDWGVSDQILPRLC
jgi:bifunctional non-homologous end joining protein LigD